MRTRIDPHDLADAILGAGDGDAAFAAWTLDELDHDELGGLRPAFARDDDAGG